MTQPTPLRSTPLWASHQIIQRLQEIDSDLAERIPKFEQAARDHYTTARDLQLEEAKQYVSAEGPVEERKAKAKKALYGMELWERAKTAEGEFYALRAAIGALETRASVLQSLLKQQREQAAA